jgi:hypothetical protein
MVERLRRKFIRHTRYQMCFAPSKEKRRLLRKLTTVTLPSETTSVTIIFFHTCTTQRGDKRTVLCGRFGYAVRVHPNRACFLNTRHRTQTQRRGCEHEKIFVQRSTRATVSYRLLLR